MLYCKYFFEILQKNFCRNLFEKKVFKKGKSILLKIDVDFFKLNTNFTVGINKPNVYVS